MYLLIHSFIHSFHTEVCTLFVGEKICLLIIVTVFIFVREIEVNNTAAHFHNVIDMNRVETKWTWISNA